MFSETNGFGLYFKRNVQVTLYTRSVQSSLKRSSCAQVRRITPGARRVSTMRDTV